MVEQSNPYASLPPTAFWRSGVAEPGLYGMSGLWRSRWRLPSDARFATYGSCFAQHISRALVANGIGWVDAEPAPARCPAPVATAFNYGVYSSRTGNIYSSAQLLHLVRLATGAADPAATEIWEDGGRYFDSLRPAIEPNGFSDPEEALLSRLSMLRAFRRSVVRADIFVYTLGLTESWENAETGQPYPICPGTLTGRFDAAAHVFHNLGFAEIRAQLEEAFTLMRALNPGLRILLTVSPVPLTATKSGHHVLVATTHSKSILRAVAGELVAADPGTDYFPSYEIIAGAPARAGFFAPNMRSVVQAGVDQVMRHFFAGLDLSAPAAHAGDAAAAIREDALNAPMDAEELACEEAVLEAFNRG